MLINIVSFSTKGHALAVKISGGLLREGDDARFEHSSLSGGGGFVRAWTRQRFRTADGLVFVGAAGIAVRAIAPELKSKTTDPAVVVVDEGGTFAISLLSGHIGGANRLTARIAAIVGATPVITTSTDVHNVFAVDTWAVRNSLAIVNPENIKRVSAALLDGKTIRMHSPFPVSGEVPGGIETAGAEAGEPDILLGIRPAEDGNPLVLVPKVAVLGIGCRKGMPAEKIEEAFVRLCRENRLFPAAFLKVCSIDVKRDEQGILDFCATRQLPFETFSADALSRLKGDFTPSGFVEATVGVDNVCERSAVAGGGETLIVGKTTLDGVTMAVAVERYVVEFGSDGSRE